MNLPEGLIFSTEVLGQGAFGLVIKAKYYDKDVAVKLTTNQYTAMCEIKSLFKVQKHKNVCEMHGWFEDKCDIGVVYGIVTPVYQTTLIDLIEKHGPLCEDNLRATFTQFMRALSHLHKRNIVHCDIKCENIMFNDNGDPILIDFGLVNTLGRAGSVSYCAPEKLTNGGAPDPSADIWSTGVCMFCAVCGFFPFLSADRTDWRFESINKYQDNGNFGTCEQIFHLYKKSVPFNKNLCQVIDKMLTICPIYRGKTFDIMNLPWFRNARSLGNINLSEINEQMS